MSKSLLSQGQIAQFTFDPTNDAVRTIPVSGGIVTEPYDYIAVTYPSGTQEVYTFLNGGSGGELVATVTVNYTDGTKANLLNVSRT